MFTLEYYFQQPSTKYNWEDFQKKAFKRNKGEELKRKMIVKNIHATTQMEYIELKHICLHMNALIQANAVVDSDYRKMYEYFTELKQYLYDYFTYCKIKERMQSSTFYFFYGLLS
jgi:hypothetical protein